MNKSKMKAFLNKVRAFIGIVLIFLFMMIALTFSSEIKEDIVFAIVSCGKILIPSLFPFMFLSTLLVKSGLAEKIGRKLNKLSFHIFRLPGVAIPVVLSSFLGGYPVGAKTISHLYKLGSISIYEVNILMLFSINAAPSFVISAIGVSMFKSFKLGVILLVTQLVSTLIIMFGVRFYIQHHMVVPVHPKKATGITSPTKKSSFSMCFVDSLNDSSKSMVAICFYVLLFAFISSVLKLTVFRSIPILKSISLPFLEISSGIIQYVNSSSVNLYLLPVFLSFGGLAIHFQIFSIMNDIPFSKKYLYLGRLVHMTISFLLTYFALKLFPVPVPTASIIKIGTHNISLSSTIASSCALLIMCMIFIFSLPIINTGENGGKQHKNIL